MAGNGLLGKQQRKVRKLKKNKNEDELIEPRESRYIACEEFNFIWTLEEVKRFDELNSSGLTVRQIAKEFNRREDEVAILEIDRKYNRKLKSFNQKGVLA